MDSVTLIQGDANSHLTPLILIHAISGLALPYFALGPLSDPANDRPIYGISSPIYTAFSYPQPKTLAQLASHYVSIVRREVQPEGPYVLGGWSLGGMIAIEMAKIFEAEGDEVSDIIMIDSLNPDLYPPFQDQKEHDTLAAITYNAIAKRMSAPEIPMHRPYFEYRNGNDSAESSDGENEADEQSISELFLNMRRHVHHGIEMLSAGSSKIPNFRLRSRITLIKCATLGRLSAALSDNRRGFAKKTFAHPTLAWEIGSFDLFRVLRLNCSHDGCFDQENAAHLTLLMKELLRDITH